MTQPDLARAIEQAHTADILEVAKRLGAKLVKGGNERIGPCPKCGGRDRFSVNPGKQIFNCRGCQTGGDVIDLVRLVYDWDFLEAVEFINGQSLAPMRPAARRREREPEADCSAAGLRLWREGVDPRVPPVQTYLASRHLELGDDIAGCVLRWHPGISAMLALFRDIRTDEPRAVSRTFLDAEGRKIRRRFLGPVAGAAVKLDADEDVLEGLHIGEGVESCMAARQLGLRPTWALGSAGAIAAFSVLPAVECLTLLAEHDDASARAVQACAERWHAAGREVLINQADFGKDLNDELREGGACPR
jgi:hypothetical protein